MSRTINELMKMSANYEELAAESLLSTAKKKEKKKPDPKAKVRNRGTVCVPAESAKDHKDHFPINDEDQARNALARVHQYSSAPPWYKGSLKGLQDLVSRKVHSKYPGIGKSEKKKKSSLEAELLAFAEEVRDSFLAKRGQQGAQAKPGHTPATQTDGVDARAVQQGLLNYYGYQSGILGNTGQNRNGVDGDWGTKSEAAFKKYLQDAKVPPGFTDVKAIKQYIASGSGGTPPWQQQQQTAFDAEAVGDQVTVYQTHLQKYRDASKQEQTRINAQGAPAARDYMAKIKDFADKSLKAIDDKLNDQKTPDQEKQELNTLRGQVAKLQTDVGVWNQYLDTKFPRQTWGATAARMDKLTKKYAQQPADPTWSGSKLDEAAPAATTGQPAAPAAQTGQTTPQQPKVPAQPAAPAAPAQQAAPTQQAQQAQPQAPAALTPERKKIITDWLSKNFDSSNELIQGWGGVLGIGAKEGIAQALADTERYTKPILQKMQHNFTGGLKYAESLAPIADQLGNEYANKLDTVQSNFNIILENIGEELQNRQWDKEKRDLARQRRY